MEICVVCVDTVYTVFVFCSNLFNLFNGDQMRDMRVHKLSYSWRSHCSLIDRVCFAYLCVYTVNADLPTCPLQHTQIYAALSANRTTRRRLFNVSPVALKCQFLFINLLLAAVN